MLYGVELMKRGHFYLCGTPIGNLEDITLRVLRVLEEVDYIAAEDTRQTRKLLEHHGIKGKLFSCFEHNEKARLPYIAEKLEQGHSVALVSNAGMPGVSDPGSRLVHELWELGHTVQVLPGASAVTASLAISGLGGGPFYFAGFLPRGGEQGKEILRKWKALSVPLLLFESPRRLLSTLLDIKDVLSEDHFCVMVRELSKVYEEVWRGTVQSLICNLKERQEVRGEITLLLAPWERDSRDAVSTEGDYLIQLLLDLNLGGREITEHLQKVLHWHRNQAYERVLYWQKKKEES